MPSRVTLEQQTDSPANCEVRVDRERLRYVTRLLGSQPGLSTALLGTLLFFMNAGEILRWLSGWSTLLAALALPALGFGILRFYPAAQERWIPEYYQRRFGSVQATREPWSKWDALFFLAFVVLLFIGWPIAHYLDPVTSSFLGHLHTMIFDPGRQINLWPSVFWMALVCSRLRWHMSSIDRRTLYFDLVALVGSASIVCYAIWHPDAKQLGWWKILNAGGLGLSFIALGLYDHITLVLLLPKRVAEGDDE